MSKHPHDVEETSDIEPDDDEMFSRRESERERDRERDRDRDRDRDRIGVTDFVKRAFENTVGSAKNTSTMSREAITYLLQQGDKGRKEVLRIVANEVGDFLRHVDLSTEIIKVLTNVQMDFNASIRFKEVEGGKISPEFSKQSGVSVTTPDDSSEVEEKEEQDLEP